LQQQQWRHCCSCLTISSHLTVSAEQCSWCCWHKVDSPRASSSSSSSSSPTWCWLRAAELAAAQHDADCRRRPRPRLQEHQHCWIDITTSRAPPPPAATVPICSSLTRQAIPSAPPVGNSLPAVPAQQL
jgi:hypothetical protein